MNLNIRLACTEEMEQVFGIQRRAIRMLCSKDYSPHQVEAIVKSQHQWRGTYERIYVAEQDQALVGCIAISPCRTNIAGIYPPPQYPLEFILGCCGASSVFFLFLCFFDNGLSPKLALLLLNPYFRVISFWR